MSIARTIRSAARKVGVDVRWYNVVHSDEARLFRQIEHHAINAVIDVGANNGGYARFLRKGGYQGEILSFEPLESPHRELLRAAKADSRWHVAPRMALGLNNGEIDINVAESSTSSSVLPMEELHVQSAPGSKYVRVERVPIRRLDGVEHPILQSDASILLKIDAQGFELPVLHGAQALLPRLRGIQLELSLSRLYTGQALYHELIEFMQDLGFDLWNIMPTFVDRRNGRLLQMDGLFFRHQSA
jgi:FkbM family methyltransferase